MKLFYLFLLLFPLMFSCARTRRIQKNNEHLIRLLGGLDTLALKMKEDKDRLAIIEEDATNYRDEAVEYKDLYEREFIKGSMIHDMIRAQAKLLNAVLLSLTEEIKKQSGHYLQASFRAGSLYISLDSIVDFPAGSSIVGPGARRSLNTIAVVLDQYPGLPVMIVGFTDSVPAKNPTHRDNWSLSAQRAINVCRILCQQSRSCSPRFTAAGKNAFDPIASNNSAAGRARNRRVEMVIHFDLSALFVSFDEDKKKLTALD